MFSSLWGLMRRAWSYVRAFAALHKAELTIAFVRGIQSGIINEWTNSYSEHPLRPGYAFLIGYVAGVVGAFIGFKYPGAGGATESLIIDFWTEWADDTEMSPDEVLEYIVTAGVLAGIPQSSFAKHFPASVPKDKITGWLVQVAWSSVINVLRGYRRVFDAF